MHSDSPIYSFGLSDDDPNITSKIISFDTLSASDKLQQIFQYEQEEKTYYINILRYYNGKPFTIQSVYLNKELLTDLDIFALKDRPLYEIIEKVLTPREKEIICLRYGLSGREAKTQREIASSMNISRSYVSRIEKRALEKLRDGFHQ